jgi:nitrite reductase/ring-hydroxylating ferredoxin subunit
MERKEFLKSIGSAAAFAITFSCLGGCSQAEDFTAPEVIIPDPVTGALLTIDLSAASSNSLKSNGGYLIKSNIVVAKNTSGNYVAATVVCSHEQKKEVIFRSNEFYCTAHGARFDLNGNGLNTDGKNGLTIYKTSLDGTILSITN